MGKVDTFTILLDRSSAVYWAGEMVTGRLFIRLAERLKINSVNIQMSGFARVHWTEQRGSGQNRTTVHYSADEIYISLKIMFLEKQEGDLYLEVGEMTYPFEITLPATLPTSFEHDYGRVRYSLNGEIDIPWAFDKHVNLGITVISPFDLNTNPALRQPANVSDQKTICCWCCKSDPIIATLSITKGGYVPGEGIVFNATVDNKSTNEIQPLTISLVQKIRLHARTKSKMWTRTVAEVNCPKKIDEKKYEEWANSVLTIPAVCSSSNGACRIITVSYYVNLNVNPTGPSSSFDVRIPIVIGTIPLRSNDSMPINSDYSHNYEPSPFGKSENNELEDKKEGEVSHTDVNFSPQYPFYKDFNIMPTK